MDRWQNDMAFWRTNQLHNRRGRAPLAFPRGLTSLAGRGVLVRWVVPGLVGVALGVYVLDVASLAPWWIPFLILIAVCPFIAMVVGNVRRWLLAAILVDIPLQLDVNIGYKGDIAQLSALEGWNVSVTTICLIALYVIWCAELLAGEKRGSSPRFRINRPLTLYLAAAMLSLVVAYNVTFASFEIFTLVQMFLFNIYIASTVRTREDLRFIVTMLMIGLVLESLIMIGVRLAGRGFSAGLLSARIDADGRVSGTIGSPNGAATYLSLLLAPALSFTLAQVGRWHKRLAALAFGLGAVALLLTFSRGGWVAFGLSVSILCVLAWRRGWLSPTVPLSIVVLVTLLTSLFQETIMLRLGAGENGRMPLIKLALSVIQDHPLLGVGANNFAVVLPQYANAEYTGTWLAVVHNKYLLVWAETGIVGLVAFIWFLVATVRRGWQCRTFDDRFLAPIALGFTAAVIGHMVHMLFDLFSDRLPVQLLWLIAGLLTALSSVQNYDRQHTQNSR